jgi:thiol-disulfide isomerase/thioredoxin
MKTSSPVGTVAAVVAALAVGAGTLYWMRAEAPKSGAAAKATVAPVLASAAPDAVAELWQAPLRDVTGKPHGLAAYKGHVLVVNFWASWCGPCVREMPLLTDLSRQYAGKGVQFVGIGVDSEQNVQSFLRKVPVGYPIFVSGFGGADLARNFGNAAGGLPFTVVIDANGAVRSTKLGEVSPEELRHTLDAIHADSPT